MTKLRKVMTSALAATLVVGSISITTPASAFGWRGGGFARPVWGGHYGFARPGWGWGGGWRRGWGYGGGWGNGGAAAAGLLGGLALGTIAGASPYYGYAGYPYGGYSGYYGAAYPYYGYSGGCTCW